jgi:TatD DNase family protein
METIDTHCHLDVPEFDRDRNTVIDRARALGVAGFVVPAIHRDGWRRLVSLCRSAPDLHPALGLHPVYIDRHRDSHVRDLEQWIEREGPVAVGEIGLDYWVRDLDRRRQLAIFVAQLTVAREADLPVLLHVRKAHDEVIAALHRIRVKGGIAHAFNGSIQQARQYIDLGFKLGFGGMLTFEHSRKLRALATALPLDALVLETDAPDMTVAAHRGERNSPEYLPDCLRALAEVRDQDPANVAERTTANARGLLGIG